MITDIISRYKELKGHKAVASQVEEIKDNLTEVIDRTEEAFDIMFDPEDIMEMTSYAKGKELLQKYEVEL